MMMQHLKTLQDVGSELSVLYVEDDKAIQKSMLKYLNNIFAEVITADDGLSGLEQYKLRDFDIVITDISMPEMNGIEMLEEIKKINDEQAVLITTAHAETDYMLSAIKDGVDGYILKPFDFKQLNYSLFKVAQKITMYKENEAYKLYLNNMVEDKTHELEELIGYQNDNYEKTLASMVEMIEQRDTYTAGHSKRVAEYSTLIAQEMGYSQSECDLIYQAGILHDVGKIGTPDAVLLNPKALNNIEYKLIQGHVSISYKLLKSIPMFKSLAEIAYSHHERYDGKGYPRGLKGKEIPPLARIMIIADSFDAMTTNRIYKSRKTVQEGLQEIKRLSGMQYDPEVVPSALVALKDVVIDENVNQLPQTKLEEERFAYFYKDTLSDAYNQNYLDIVLMKNTHEKFFSHMLIVSLKGFSKFNKEYGWAKGDQILIRIGNELVKSFRHAYVFRIFGDDFVLMDNREFEKLKVNKLLEEICQDTEVGFDIDIVNLHENPLDKISEIESIQLTS
jgi:putative nucleotidyltransferase with HDIG domain